jgi:hypothetical protein
METRYDDSSAGRWTLRPDIAEWCRINMNYVPPIFDPDKITGERSDDMAIEFKAEDHLVLFKLKWV